MSTYKKSSFFSLGPVSSALMCSTTVAAGDMPGPLARGAFSSEGDMDKEKEAAQCNVLQPTPLPRVVEDFFWIGNSLMAFSKWRLGYMGKPSSVRPTTY